MNFKDVEVVKNSPWNYLTNKNEIKELLIQRHDAFIFDMDGVLWKVNTPIPGASKALKFLREQKKMVFFATNNSFQRAKQYAEKLKRLGLGSFPESTIFCSANAVTLCLKQKAFKGKVFMIGPKSLRQELSELEDLEIIEGKTENLTPYEMAEVDIDLSIRAVVIGFDHTFNYYKLAYATAILNNNPNALFICTNADRKFPTQRWILPGTGSFVAALETASERKALVAGKPSSVIIDELLSRYPQLEKHKICMVGDNMLTDIDFGRKNGLTTLLVETGVHSRQDFDKSEYAEVLPDYVVSSVEQLCV